MTEDIFAPRRPVPFSGQPFRIVERDGIRYTLLGTAHVSKASVDAVREAIASGDYDAVAVELDPQRLQALTNPDSLQNLDLVKVLREGKAALLAANLGLGAYQRRLAEQLGVEPGAELRAAAEDANAAGLPLHLIDRDVSLTFKRISQRLGWWGRTKLASGLLAGMLSRDDVDEADIERLKEGDMLESAFSEFAEDTPALYETLIDERDRYMAARLREQTPRQSGEKPPHVLAVVGAGHLRGMAQYLENDEDNPAEIRATLETSKEGSGFPWLTAIVVALVLGGFAWGFWSGGFDLGGTLLLQWVLVTGILGAIGCALARAHPLSILAAFVCSPITPLHPALAAGMVTGVIEATLRRPNYGDFMALRADVQSVKGWYSNRVLRVLLTFFLTNLGTSLGVWISGFRMIRTLFA